MPTTGKLPPLFPLLKHHRMKHTASKAKQNTDTTLKIQWHLWMPPMWVIYRQNHGGSQVKEINYYVYCLIYFVLSLKTTWEQSRLKYKAFGWSTILIDPMQLSVMNLEHNFNGLPLHPSMPTCIKVLHCLLSLNWDVVGTFSRHTLTHLLVQCPSICMSLTAP